jgi:hypothetical protein
MKCFVFATALVLAMLGQSSAQEIDRSRAPSDEPVPVSVSTAQRDAPQTQVAPPAPPAPAVATPPAAPYNVEDPRAVIDWLLNRPSIGR